MDNLAMVQAFNEWMRRFMEEPEKFAHEFQAVNQFIKDEQAGVEPSYGQVCAGYMQRLAAQETSAGNV